MSPIGGHLVLIIWFSYKQQCSQYSYLTQGHGFLSSVCMGVCVSIRYHTRLSNVLAKHGSSNM